MANETEQSVGPVAPDCSAAKSLDQPLQQPRVLALLGYKELQGIEVSGIVTDLLACPIEQEGAFSGFAQLEMRQGASQRRLHRGIQRAWRIPFRLRPVMSIVSVISEP